MNKTVMIGVALLVSVLVCIPVGGRFMPQQSTEAVAAAASANGSYSAVPNAVGAEDISGPYDVVQGWPKDLASLPGHEKWTWGGARGIFAESPNRVYLLQGGEL